MLGLRWIFSWIRRPSGPHTDGPILVPSVCPKIMRRSSANHQKMADWVHMLAPWQVKADFTFRGEFTQWSTQRAFERFMCRSLPSVSYFYAVERNPSRHGHHVHALFADCAGLQRRLVWDNWFKRFGRARIEPVRSSDDVTSYCSKYCTKDDAWWDFKLRNPDLWSVWMRRAAEHNDRMERNRLAAAQLASSERSEAEAQSCIVESASPAVDTAGMIDAALSIATQPATS